MPLQKLRSLLAIPVDPKRVYGLDCLRAFAIVCVVHVHGSSLLSPIVDPFVARAISFDGVSIFFVLSGFLIGGILIRTTAAEGFGASQLRRFWIRRWFRTLPNYFLVLIVLVGLTNLTADLRIESTIPYFFFVQNFASPHPAFFPEAWSLSIEEWFYLGVPLAALVATRAGLHHRAAFVGIIIAVVVGTHLYRYVLVLNLEQFTNANWDGMFRKVVVARMDGLMLGVLGAYLSIHHERFWSRIRMPALGLGVVLLLVHQVTRRMNREMLLDDYTLYFFVFSFSLISVATLCLLPYLSSLRTGSGWVHRVVTRTSLVSYSMYLVHLSLVQHLLMPLAAPILPALDSPEAAVVHYSVFWGVTILLSILMYKFFEVPVTRLRDRFA